MTVDDVEARVGSGVSLRFDIQPPIDGERERLLEDGLVVDWKWVSEWDCELGPIVGSLYKADLSD